MTGFITKPRVSIVMPTYNQASFLREAIKSVVQQSMSDWELIVINNYSDDETVEIVQGFNDARISLINFHNHGVIGAARNRGIEKACAEWVAFLDSDDTWHARKLERCLRYIDQHRGVDLVGHGMIFVQDGQECQHHDSGPEKHLSYKSLLYRRNALTPSAVLVRRESLIRVGCFSESPTFVTAEDHDLWLKLARFGSRLKIIPDYLTYYRIHSNSASKAIERQMNASLSVLTSHYQTIEAPTLIDSLRFRRIQAVNFYASGRRMQASNGIRNAFHWYFKSIRHYPLFIRPYIGLLLSLFPKWMTGH